MDSEYKMYPGVSLGIEPRIGPWALLGVPPRGRKEGESTLLIGERANIRSHTVIYAGGKIGNDFSTGHGALIRENIAIGDNVSIGSGTEIEQNCVIGNNVRVHSHCFIAEGTVIEDGVKIAPGVNMASDRHPLLPEEKKKRRGPHIGKKVYIGMGATILPGITIGEGSFIGAGSVVTKDIPAGMVAFGNPAKVMMSVKEYIRKVLK